MTHSATYSPDDNNQEPRPMKTITLEFRWTVSRGRDTYGYNICSLYADGRKVAACNGGGYDMKGTSYGIFIARRYADRLLALTPADMPEQRHWERAEPIPKVCLNLDCTISRVESGAEIERHPADLENCPHCGHELDKDWHAGRTVQDGRYFYGLTFHDPNYDPGKAVIGKDCNDRTLGGPSEGETVEQAEQAGKSFGLERYQAVYTASSKHATDRHTIPSIDGACGMSSVETIAKAIGLTLRYVPTRSKKTTIYELIDEREKDDLREENAELKRQIAALDPNGRDS